MPVLFARVELCGTPTEAIYEKLHAHMKGLNWFQYLPGHPAKPMPHAMYQAEYTVQPNTLEVAKYLKKEVEENIWTKVVVLVIRESNWAQAA